MAGDETRAAKIGSHSLSLSATTLDASQFFDETCAHFPKEKEVCCLWSASFSILETNLMVLAMVLA